MIANLKSIVESLVFVSETPLSLNRLKAILGDVDLRDIRLALAELHGEYEDRQGGFALQEVAGGYQFRTRSAYSDWIKKLLKPSPTRLSRAALETLAIIAYKQPIIRADVEHIRGVDSGGVLRLLLEKKLIRVLGRKDIPGRPMIYGTTKDFLEIFNLKDLSELPSPKEITSLGSPDRDDARDEALDAEDVNTLAELSEGPAPAEDVSQETDAPLEVNLPAEADETDGTDDLMTPAPSFNELPPTTESATAEDELSHFETAKSVPPPPDDRPDGETSTSPADRNEPKA
ncbi:MAG: SMC-Scp complex subunit ScpB [Desulfobacterales bacterium]|jgi:segregation and condensation protein B